MARSKYKKFYDYDETAPIWVKRIVELMNINEVTQEELAITCGVSKSTVHGWLKGNVEPKIGNFISICEKFNVSVDYIAGLSNVKKLNPSLQQIGAKTGLSDESINQILELNNQESGLHELHSILDEMLSSDNFIALLRNISNYKELCHIPKVSSYNAVTHSLYSNVRDIEDAIKVELFSASNTLTELIRDVGSNPIEPEMIIDAFRKIYYELFHEYPPIRDDINLEYCQLKQAIENNIPIVDSLTTSE